jgi:D-3-phosphoglycerate dehydrogenase
MNGGEGKDADDAGAQTTSFPKNKIKVLLLESISGSAVKLFQEEGFQVESVHELTEEQLVAKIPAVHILGIRSKTQLTAKVIKAARRLLAVGCFCIGTDQVDLEAAEKAGIPVFNSPYANTRSVAEMVVAELVILARQMGDRSAECHAGKWNKASKGCHEVRGKTLGIVGYGHVGSQLSILAEAMGMRVIYHDIVPILPLGNARACRSLEELLEAADFVSLHVPKTDQTRGLIGERQIALMRPGSFLVNASRGDVVDVDAAAAALRRGHLAGAAFDVYPYEPGSKNEEFKSPLRGCPNTFLTPHIGGSTEEAQTAIGVEVSTKLIAFMNEGNTMGAVNFPNVALPLDRSAHRILNVHQNVPGVLRDINNVLSQYNITAQVLMTRDSIGYLVVNVDKEVSLACKEAIDKLGTNVRTRVLF